MHAAEKRITLRFALGGSALTRRYSGCGLGFARRLAHYWSGRRIVDAILPTFCGALMKLSRFPVAQRRALPLPQRGHQGRAMKSCALAHFRGDGKRSFNG